MVRAVRPDLHDAIQGPVEEFLTGDTALGYAEAAPGGTFVRIGVGVLRKPAEETSLQRFGRYDIVDGGKWTTTPARTASSSCTSWTTAPATPTAIARRCAWTATSLIIEHELKNTGTKPIVTEVYNHNFFTLDRQDDGARHRGALPVRARRRPGR